MLFPLIAAFAATAAAPDQALEPVACAAEPNFQTRERLPFTGRAVRLTGRIVAEDLQPRDFAPFAIVGLVQGSREEELAATLSIQPATARRYDVTLRRQVAGALRQRSVIGRAPTGAPLAFSVEVDEAGGTVFRVGDVRQAVPAGDFRPDALVLGCASGRFRFENLVVERL